MFKDILFATSASPACDYAARVAFAMAQRYNTHMTIFHVLGVPTRGYSQKVLDFTTGEKVELDDEYLAGVEEEIKVYYSRQLETAKNFDIKIAIGLPHREILREARDFKPDLVIMGGSTKDEGVSVYEKNMVGSTLQRVAKSIHCPVLVVNRPAASFWGGMSSVVFGTDFSKASDAAFQFALEVVNTLDCELHIFHALDITDIQTGKHFSQDEIETKIRASLKQIRGRYIKSLKKGRDYSFDVWEGIPYIEIVKYAREKHADLIVMAHHTQKVDAKDNRLGSNIEQVMMRAGCPVISINK